MNKFTVFFLSIFIFCSTLLTSPASGQWKEIANVYCGYYSCSICYEQNILVGSVMSCVHLSTDGGKTWKSIDEASPNINAVTSFAKTKTEIFVALDNYGVLRSMNGGFNWKGITDGFPKNCYDIKLACYQNNIIACICSKKNNGLYHRNNSKYWEKLNTSSIRKELTCVATSDSVIYLGTRGEYVYKSADFGLTWELISDGLSSDYIENLYSFNQKVIAITNEGIDIYDNELNVWSKIKNKMPSGSFKCLTTYGNYIIMGLSSGVYVSNDDGNSWTEKNEGLGGSMLTSLLDYSFYSLLVHDEYIYGFHMKNSIWRRGLSELIN